MKDETADGHQEAHHEQEHGDDRLDVAELKARILLLLRQNVFDVDEEENRGEERRDAEADEDEERPQFEGEAQAARVEEQQRDGQERRPQPRRVLPDGEEAELQVHLPLHLLAELRPQNHADARNQLGGKQATSNPMRQPLELLRNSEQKQNERRRADGEDADVEGEVVELLQIVGWVEVGDGNHFRRYEHQRSGHERAGDHRRGNLERNN